MKKYWICCPFAETVRSFTNLDDVTECIIDMVESEGAGVDDIFLIEGEQLELNITKPSNASVTIGGRNAGH